MLFPKAKRTTYRKRTIRPLYQQQGPTPPYPHAGHLDRDAIADRVIWPGMVATQLDSGLFSVASLGDKPFGLFANFVNGDLGEIPDDMSEVGIWQMGLFELLFHLDGSPLVDDTWFGSKVTKPVYWNDRGEITMHKSYPKQPSLGILDDISIWPSQPNSFHIQIDLRL